MVLQLHWLYRSIIYLPFVFNYCRNLVILFTYWLKKIKKLNMGGFVYFCHKGNGFCPKGVLPMGFCPRGVCSYIHKYIGPEKVIMSAK